MSTWSEDFAYSLETLHMPHPGDLGPADVAELIGAIAVGAEVSGKGASVAIAIKSAGAAGAKFVAGVGSLVAVGAAAYIGALIGAVIYASAKQSWDAVTAPIDLDRMLELARQWEAPIIDLPAGSDVSWYPDTSTARVEAPPPPPPYPGVIKFNSTDKDSVERIQQVLENHGYDISVTGNFREKTEAAVRAFQKEQGLEVDGEVGSDTWDALFGS